MNSLENTSPRVLKMGIVGFGKLGLLHTGIFNGLENSRVVAIADTSAPMLSLLKSKMDGVQVYQSHNAMLKECDLDGVIIATPSNLHVPIALDCVASRRPVMIEKPLSTTFDEALPLVRALADEPVTNMVAYMTRHVDTFRTAREAITSGALGKLQSFRSSMYIGQLFRPGKGWRYSKKASGGGVLITQNSHLIDQLVWMFGDVEWVSGHQRHLYSTDVEDCAHAYFKFANGLTGYLDSSWSARHRRKLLMTIHVQGENGTLDVDDDEIRVFLDADHGKWKSGWNTLAKPDLFEPVSLDVGGPHYTRQAEEFLTAVRSGGAVSSDVVSAVRVQSIIEAFYFSAATDGTPVTPKKVP
jgi:predicted dehydrogenase